MAGMRYRSLGDRSPNSRRKGPSNGAKAGERLGAILGDWDKTRLRFADFRAGVDDAVRRTKALPQPPQANPSTAVWQLIEALRQDQAVEKEN